jgi:hypothetical protein
MSSDTIAELTLVQAVDMPGGVRMPRMVYNIADRLPLILVKELVEYGNTYECSVVMDEETVHGFLPVLWARYGDDVLPMRSEGLIHMYWRQFYKGQDLECALQKEQLPAQFEASKYEDRRYVHGYLESPEIAGAIFVRGKHPTGDEMVVDSVRYCLCKDADDEVRVEVPLAVKYEFFSKNVLPVVGRLYETATYAHGSFEYSAQYHQRHVQAMDALLEHIPRTEKFVEPGCGMGVVLSLRPGNVKAGDLYPPLGASLTIQKEEVSQTLRRGTKDDIYVCAYISHFLSHEDRIYLCDKKVIWVDSPAKMIPERSAGDQIYPGVFFQNIPRKWYPTRFVLEKQIVSVPLQYTENLLNGASYVVLSESESVRYLRAQRPHVPLVYHPVYQGNFRSQHKKADRVLASTIEEVLLCQRCFHRPAYFAPIGREISTVFTEANLLVVNHGTHVYYEHRQLYSIPVSDAYLCAIFRGLPSKEISGRLYFYDPKESLDPRPIHYLTQTSLVVGTLHPKIGMDKPIVVDMKSVNQHRIYITINDIRIPMRWDGSYASLLQLLRTAFPSRIDSQVLSQLLDLYEQVGGQYRTTTRKSLESVKNWAKWLSTEVG